MEPTGKLPPQPWMQAPETRTLMAALDDAGIEARFIGGCVRDSILKRPVNDIDIATPVDPETVMAALAERGIRVIPTGIAHGTITAVIDKAHFEITTLRIDIKTDGRRARVAFTDDWTQDAARRDFTINALSANMDGDIFDPYMGLDDLGRGKVRFVGIAENRINEDVLRLLRFFRFYAEYGKPPIDAEALAACRKLAGRLGELSGERVRGELFRILTGPNPADIITLMRSEHVLEQILPEAGDSARMRSLAWLLERGVHLDDVNPDPVRRLAALLKPGITIDEVTRVCERLKFSTREKRHLLAITNPPMMEPALPPDCDWQATDIRRACYHVGRDCTMDMALINWAGRLGERPHQPPGETAKWEKVLSEISSWVEISFPLKGRDAQELGMTPGPEMGRVLAMVEQWWEEGDYRAGHDECLAELKRVVSSLNS